MSVLGSKTLHSAAALLSLSKEQNARSHDTTTTAVAALKLYRNKDSGDMSDCLQQ